jgi:AcrR family transcriptional regulator
MSRKPAKARAPARDRAATERRILDAAERLIAEEGFTALNVSTLAAAAGVDRKLIYRYFTDVDGVVARLGARTERWGGKAPTKPAGPTYADTLVGALRDYAGDLARDETLQRMLAWELTGSSDALSALDAARSAAMQARMASVRGDQAPPAGADPGATVAVALAALHYLVLRRRTMGGFAGLKLDAKGLARATAVIERMVMRELS